MQVSWLKQLAEEDMLEMQYNEWQKNRTVGKDHTDKRSTKNAHMALPQIKHSEPCYHCFWQMTVLFLEYSKATLIQI